MVELSPEQSQKIIDFFRNEVVHKRVSDDDWLRVGDIIQFKLGMFIFVLEHAHHQGDFNDFDSYDLGVIHLAGWEVVHIKKLSGMPVIHAIDDIWHEVEKLYQKKPGGMPFLFGRELAIKSFEEFLAKLK